MIYHARWWVRLRSGTIIKWISDEGVETPFREVQRRAADDPIVEIGWEPVSEVVANLATARGIPMQPNALEPQSVEVPDGCRDVLPPVEIAEALNVMGGQLRSAGQPYALEYRVLLDGQIALQLRPKG